ncbi:MAG: hypothetical protein WDW38_007469 [Sanguina aurantia]
MQHVDSVGLPAIVSQQTLEEGSRQMALSNYSEKLIEQKERELRESIAANYSRMRGVEKELSNLQLQLKLTAGPKRLALELYRKKIEVQNEKVACIKLRHTAAKRALEAIDAELQQEEATKAELCDALNTLVQQSALLQLNKLEELKQHLDSLARGVTGEGPSHPHHPGPPQQQSHQQHAVGAPTSAAGGAAAGEAAAAHRANTQGVSPELMAVDAERAAEAAAAASAAAAAAKATAAAARARHVSIRPKSHVAASPAGTGTEPSSVKVQQQQQQGAGQRGGGAKFDGFDA